MISQFDIVLCNGTTRKRFTAICLAILVGALFAPLYANAQGKKVRVALPGYTIAALSFLVAKTNGYYSAEGMDVELIAMRAPTANLAVLGGNVEFSGVPLAGLTTALRGGGLKLLFCQFDKPQHSLFARPEYSSVKALRGKKLAVVGLGSIDDFMLREVLMANGIDPSREVTILAMGAADTRLTSLVSGAVDAAVLIAPVSFYAKEQGFKELVSFQEQGFVLPSGGITARDDYVKADPVTAEKFVRATLMGFLYMRDNRAGTLKVMTRMLRIDDATAAKVYDASRPTMTVDGTVSGEVEKKMTSFVLKTAGAKDAPPADKLYDFTLVKKAYAALQAKGWHPAP
jgi:ABC-type nitrate/sulfonate/bicarbonate transport system substrate-binding protein